MYLFSVLVTVSVFSASRGEASSFFNPAIERDKINPEFSEEYQSELADLEEDCKAIGDLSVIETMSLDHVGQVKGEFAYYYRHIINDPNLPTIVVIPGGPGAGSIGNVWGGGNYNYLRIDPRGVGCNYGYYEDFPSSTMNSAQHVHDILAVIERLGLKQYVLYGKSYGTLVATRLAAEIDKRELPKPRAVVLEGVIGKAYPEPDAWARGLTGVANSFLKQSPNIQSMFTGEHMPLGFSDDYWGNYLSLVGDEWEDKKQTLLQLKKELGSGVNDSDLIRKFQEDHQDFLAGRENLGQPREELVGDFVLYEVSCREVAAQVCGLIYVFQFKEGRFVPLATEHLFSPAKYQGIPMDAPFDSANYEISVPIYYFQGTADPNTPIDGARYHLENQRTLGKGNNHLVFQSFEHRGHSPLMDLLVFGEEECWDNAFASIFSLDKDLSSVFDSKGNCL